MSVPRWDDVENIRVAGAWDVVRTRPARSRFRGGRNMVFKNSGLVIELMVS